jgi:hypothetical protein
MIPISEESVKQSVPLEFIEKRDSRSRCVTNEGALASSEYCSSLRSQSTEPQAQDCSLGPNNPDAPEYVDADGCQTSDTNSESREPTVADQSASQPIALVQTERVDPVSMEAKPENDPAILDVATDYLQRGFSIAPQRPGEKHPCVRWKPYQERRPTHDEVQAWFHQWPDAGVAVVLGAVSNLFAIDVDGQDAHDALIAKLGCEPIVPKVLSGSGKPYRYHLFFRYPAGLVTQAKWTPWHRHLEFRGHKGLIILPPSVHQSGNRYQWAPGQSLDDLALPEVPALILAELQARAVKAASKQYQPEAGVSKIILDTRQKLAREYIAQMPAAVEGNGGDQETFSVACQLVLGFHLTVDQALPLLKEYNQRCRPPWNEDQLRHKLEEADKKDGERGYLLRQLRSNNQAAETTDQATPDRPDSLAVPFLGHVPNFIQADWTRVRQLAQPVVPNGSAKPGRRSVMGGLYWLVSREVIAQQHSLVVLPDSIAAQAIWSGARQQWPANWRQMILRYLQKRCKSATLVDRCSGQCPLRERRDPHRHFVVRIRTLQDTPQQKETFLGLLEEFGQDDGHGGRIYNWSTPTARSQAAKKEGRLVAVYLPVLLFGKSPRSGLSPDQVRVLACLTHEITRAARSHREDKAGLVVSVPVPKSASTTDVVHCPYLEKGRQYVAFNGNGSFRRSTRRGRGYRLVGRTHGGWLRKARYPISDDEERRWQQVRTFLKVLESLVECFVENLANPRQLLAHLIQHEHS